LIRVSVEVCSGSTRFRAAVWAKSIERALNLVKARYPGGEARVIFPIEPEAFFCDGSSPTCEAVRPEGVEDGHVAPTGVHAQEEQKGRALKAMVLAAGKGTRLFPLTGEIPKPMAPVVGKPIIGHIFELLAQTGVDEIHVNIHYLAEAILDVYGYTTSFNGTKVCMTREDELMGTAGGVKRIAECFGETFVVIMGDALTDVDVRDVVAFHKERGALATLALMRVADTSQYGVVELDSEQNVVSFQEKPAVERAISNLANTGIYVLEPEVLEYIPKNTFFDFAEDVFPRLLAAGERLAGYEGSFYWSDIGNLEAYRAAQRDALSGKVRVKIPGEQLEGGLWMERDSQVHPTLTLEGRAMIGHDVVIGRGVTLIGDVTVGDGCWVRSGATIKRSILLPGSYVGDGAYLEDCIVGHGYDVRAGEQIRGGALVRHMRAGGPSPSPNRSRHVA
jgi:mannose-1-phosphate guanylyltransferase